MVECAEMPEVAALPELVEGSAHSLDSALEAFAPLVATGPLPSTPNRLLKNSFCVMPAKASIQNSERKMDFRFLRPVLIKHMETERGAEMTVMGNSRLFQHPAKAFVPLIAIKLLPSAGSGKGFPSAVPPTPDSVSRR